MSVSIFAELGIWLFYKGKPFSMICQFRGVWKKSTAKTGYFAVRKTREIQQRMGKVGKATWK